VVLGEEIGDKGAPILPPSPAIDPFFFHGSSATLNSSGHEIVMQREKRTRRTTSFISLVLMFMISATISPYRPSN
jgi:hypothetical protein